ncbi:DUF7109 family protein [Halorussus halophilus]|uniref:DUF7109 family protein n=1 Tax=Halorussus halophilus TaxID=2650975 RepID=UPI00130168A0|nr:hypothetical protein [Halorussus halophilus]
MSNTTDELAGVVDLFDALTHEELEQALVELAFKQGKDVDRDAFAAVIERAVEQFHLVEVERGEGEEMLLLAGPAAFPTVPENGTDLPHIMDVPERDIDREGLGEQVAERLREESRVVAASGDAERAEELMDVSYDLEAWAPVETDDVRANLDRAFD